MALFAARQTQGWGYNRITSCDADSASWVIRFLARLGRLSGVSASAMLSRYIMPTGRVRTFPSVDRFGSWAMEHDEVAPLAGLALLAAKEPGQVAAIRSAILETWMGRGWQSFW